MKKFTIQYTIATLAIIVFVAGCKKNERLMYKNAPEIYFTNSVPSSVGDSIPYSFVVKSDDIIRDTVKIALRISGFAADKERTVKINIDKSSTAQEGLHYKIDPVVVKAGEYTAVLPVILYRTPDMKDQEFQIRVNLEESADFALGYGSRRFLINVTDQLQQPNDWPSWIYDTYSKRKHQFMVSTLNSVKITESLGAQLSEMLAILQKMRLELLKYEQENGPMIDEKGNRVTFPSF